jgi:hypothetical protein
MGGWPRFAPADLGATVQLANAVVAASGRRVDWVHIPVLPDADERFLRPLAELRPASAAVYLGTVHSMERFEERLRLARKVLPEFGVGAYCGFGRLSPAEMDRVLNEHLLAAKRIA